MNIPIDITILRELYERAEKIILINQHGKSVACTESRKQAGKIMQAIDGVMRPNEKHGNTPVHDGGERHKLASIVGAAAYAETYRQMTPKHEQADPGRASNG